MREWKEYKLSDITELIGGGTPKTTVPEYWDGDIPWLSVVDFNNGRKVVIDTEKKITKKGLQESSTKILNKGQLIVSARGTIGALAVLGRDMAFNQSCYGLNAKENFTSNGYLYYLIKDNVSSLLRNTHGAVFDTITRETFDHISVELPPLPEQKSIVSILSSLDDKIDLLHRQNKTLEALAETLFRQWFVEEAEEGWATTRLGDLCERITKGTTPTTLKRNFAERGINFIKVESITESGYFIPEKFSFIDEETDKLLSRSRLKTDDVLYTIAGTIGRTAIVTKEILPANTNQAIAIIRIDKTKVFLYFIKYCLKLTSFKNLLESKVVHAVQPNLSLGEISDTEITLPPDDLMNKFKEIVVPVEQKINKNTTQIRSLSRLRDTLLPKLMSGEVRINNE